MSYTINPNAKSRWARNAENTMDLSLETDASSVYLDNGRTLEQEIEEGSMVSNVTTVDSAMNKIIDGTLDGAYESLVFKGKSLVNLVEKPTSANVGDSKKWNGYGGGNPSKTFITNGIRLANTRQGSIVLDYFDLSLFKPNTKYTLFIDVYHNGEGTAPVLDKIAGTGQCAIPLENGHNCIVFTSVSDLTAANMRIRFGYAGSTSESCVYEFSNIVIVEGDHSSINPDYFTGLCDVKMPILHNVNKKTYSTTYVVGNLSGTNGEEVSHGNMRRTDYIDTSSSRGREITVSCNGAFELFIEKAMLYDENKKYLRRAINKEMLNSPTTFTVPNDAKYCRFTFCKRDYAEMTENDFQSVKIVIEEGSAEDSKKPYKTNILRTSEEVVLREVNGVQDTYNPLTGEYVQRIKERVFNGSETWVQNGQHTDGSYRHICNTYTDAKTSSNNVLCDKMSFVKVNSSTGEGMTSDIHITFTTTTGKIQIATTKPLSELKTWLSQNPITVQYELVEPITTIVESLTTPFAYQNGHIILESGYEGQSLLPILEYSTVVNKTVLVENVAKTIQRQEKQLTMLEKMLIQNIINLDYNNTLLTLKNEMEEML